ncbi:hypothetical protein N1851_030177 [Merluccius polli]|uniref:Reverse transcriptase domain-containing protein n=1 Tax=Merluccius polli TaxID=89951 RepID=A0AA47M6B0_MERPO|nr:hypothetical protein N1851_030177 [Merluccius polli]
MDSDLGLYGFGSAVRLDRDATTTGKCTGGGRENLHGRCRNAYGGITSLTSVGKLPCEFPQLFVTLVYIHPKANSNNACEIISQVTQSLQILGDMNNCSLSKTLRDFHQYVTCPTRQNKTLDLCYCSVKNAFKSIPLPPLGSSDHNCVHLIHSYQTALKRLKPETVYIKDWSDDPCLALQGCLECTDLDMFKDSCSDIDELTDVISSWVSYCEDTVIPIKAVKVYPNSKPWVTKSLKGLLREKNRVFKEGNLLVLHKLQKDIKREIRVGKLKYKDKLETQLKMNNLGSAWDSMKTIVGLKDRGKRKLEFNSIPDPAQLGPIFYYTFSLALSLPSLWKQSVVVPVAKISRPQTLNDFRPVALTSLIAKSFEKLIKAELLVKVEPLLDPYQFTYRAKRGVQDATITLLNLLYKHLEKSGNHARLLFVDFSSAFNTIQPHILTEKLLNNFSLDPSLTGWLLDVLTQRVQRVRVNKVLSGGLTSSTGSPQGCVLSPVVHTVHQ